MGAYKELLIPVYEDAQGVPACQSGTSRCLFLDTEGCVVEGGFSGLCKITTEAIHNGRPDIECPLHNERFAKRWKEWIIEDKEANNAE